MAQLKLDLARPDLEGIIGQAIGDLPEDLGREIIRALQAPGSTVRVKTGLMKASFGWRVNDGRVKLTNATDYAQRVEDSYGDVGDTIEAAAPRIADKMDDLLLKRFNG